MSKESGKKTMAETRPKEMFLYHFPEEGITIEAESREEAEKKLKKKKK